MHARNGYFKLGVVDGFDVSTATAFDGTELKSPFFVLNVNFYETIHSLGFKKKEGYLKLFGTHFVLQKVLFLSMPPPPSTLKDFIYCPCLQTYVFLRKRAIHICK